MANPINAATDPFVLGDSTKDGDVVLVRAVAYDDSVPIRVGKIAWVTGSKVKALVEGSVLEYVSGTATRRQAPKKVAAPPPAPDEPYDLKGMRHDELYALAQRHSVSGRTKMSDDQLRVALAEALGYS